MRQAGWQKGMKVGNKVSRQVQVSRMADRQAKTETYRQEGRQVDGKVGEKGKKVGRQAGKQAWRQIGRQANRSTRLVSQVRESCYAGRQAAVWVEGFSGGRWILGMLKKATIKRCSVSFLLRLPIGISIEYLRVCYEGGCRVFSGQGCSLCDSYCGCMRM